MMLRHIILYLFLLGGCHAVSAQDATDTERMAVTFQIMGKEGTNGAPQIYPVEYAVFKTISKARNVAEQLNRATIKDGYPGGPEYEAELLRNNVKLKKAKANGTFIVRAYAGQGVMVYVGEQAFSTYEVKEGQTDYKDILEFKIDGTHTISNTDVIGKRKVETIDIKALPPVDDGLYMLVPVTFRLRKGDVGNRSRVMVQPITIDCQTEDTVDFVSPLIYEGNEYNVVQNRRMDFDYFKNEMDSIARGYVSNHPLSDTVALAVDTMLIYMKKDASREYRFSYDITAEDYTHCNLHLTKAAGSCNKYRLFKFLNLNGVSADLPLAEYRTDAEETMRSVPRDLKLNFLVGKSELVPDSLNDVRLEMLIKEMKDYGDQLMRIEIEAYASPDGGYEKNMQLAKQRGQVAMNLVMRGLGRADVTKGLKTHVYSWADVAKELVSLGEQGKADSVGHIAETGGKSPDALMRALPFYTSHVEPILEGMRSMRCVYKYEQMHIMEADELLEFYHKNKSRMLAGDKGVKLSDGDWFNLFACVNDSLEQDTITMLAYRHMTAQPAWEKIKFSQYVANRMAMLQLRAGHPSTETLAPFVNLTTSRSPIFIDGVQVNRKEILINHIMAYYQLEKRDSAVALLNFWFAGSGDPEVQELRNYVSFKENFLKYYMGRLDPSMEDSYRETEEYVLNSFPDNRAILYTEARAYMKKSNTECRELVNAMSDENAKKWYLLGILEADDESVRDVKDKNYIPLYLAFFYKSFEIDPDLRLTYFSEAHVNDELRQKYKYRKRDIPRYRELLAEYLGEQSGANGDDDDVSGVYDDEDTN